MCDSVVATVTTPKRHALYYLETIVFQIDNTLFRVPSRYLRENSEILGAASEISATTEGTSDATPVELPLPDGATIGDFESFVKAVYPMNIDLPAPTSFSKAQWISILKLSTCWMFDDLRKLAIRNISPSPSEKVVLGRRYKVKQWLSEGLRGLSEPSSLLLPLEELANLGEGTAMRLLYIRNAAPVQTNRCPRLQKDIRSSGYSYCSSCGAATGNHLTEPSPKPISVEKLFSDELDLLSD